MSARNTDSVCECVPNWQEENTDLCEIIFYLHTVLTVIIDIMHEITISM